MERAAANFALGSWRWTAIVLPFAVGGCDLFSFPAPLRAKDQGASGAAAVALVTALGDPCPPSADCGTDSNGEAMACARASALGGTDFCAPRCSPGAEPPAGQVCSRWEALLPACQPHLESAAADCPAGLNCYRTSLLEDRGVCLKMPVCAEDDDCKQDPIHATCAATLVRRVGGAQLAALPLDHLNCVKESCVDLHTQCPPSESCLASQYDRTVADICVPNCDASRPCPPNYSCIPTALENHEELVGLCMPGLPGIRCEPGGCVAGNCEDTGAGFSVCTGNCKSTAECQGFSGPYDAFVCVDGVDHKQCVTPRAFHGSGCNRDDDCREDLDEFCSLWVPRGLDKRPGGCRQRCSAEGTCSPRGGLPHTCLWEGKGGCYPGTQGLPCRLQSECIAGLSCLEAPPEPDLDDAPTKICTQPCDGPDQATSDAVCDKKNDINGAGYCAAGYCRARRPPDAGCSRNAQCKSRLCNGAKCLE